MFRKIKRVIFNSGFVGSAWLKARNVEYLSQVQISYAETCDLAESTNPPIILSPDMC